MLDDQLKRALDRRRDRGILRGLKSYEVVRETRSAGMEDRGQPSCSPASLVDFSSNDYMGLARCDAVRQRIVEVLQNGKVGDPIGSTGSRLLDGNSRAHERLESRLARHFRSPTALLFNSGYDANSSLLSVLPQPDDYILYDEYAHASMHDGMRASRTQRGRRIAFQHNDMQDLKAKLDTVVTEISEAATRSNVFFAVEAVYSMDGDTCPLSQLISIVDAALPRQQRCIVVDEAHAVGLYGKQGSGFCEQLGVSSSIDIRLATFGKAFGCSGAAVLCTPLVRLFLINYARPLVFSTAIPHTSLIAIDAALDVLCSSQGAERAAKTFALTRQFILELTDTLAGNDDAYTPSALDQSLLDLASPPPIVPIVTRRAKELAQYLIVNGFLVRPISFPTVPKDLERVRICIHAHNTPEQIHALTRTIKAWLALQPRQPRRTEGVVAIDDALEKAKL